MVGAGQAYHEEQIVAGAENNREKNLDPSRKAKDSFCFRFGRGA